MLEPPSFGQASVVDLGLKLRLDEANGGDSGMGIAIERERVSPFERRRINEGAVSAKLGFGSLLKVGSHTFSALKRG